MDFCVSVHTCVRVRARVVLVYNLVVNNVLFGDSYVGFYGSAHMCLCVRARIVWVCIFCVCMMKNVNVLFVGAAAVYLC